MTDGFGKLLLEISGEMSSIAASAAGPAVKLSVAQNNLVTAITALPAEFQRGNVADSVEAVCMAIKENEDAYDAQAEFVQRSKAALVSMRERLSNAVTKA